MYIDRYDFKDKTILPYIPVGIKEIMKKKTKKNTILLLKAIKYLLTDATMNQYVNEK